MSDAGTRENGPQLRNRIVAFVDVLGASHAALSDQTANLVSNIFRLKRTMQWTHRIHLRNAEGTTEIQEFRPGIAQFSDCLLLWSEPLDGLSPEQFVRATGSFMSNLCVQMGRLLLADIPFRAGVSEGPVFIDSELSIYAGRPIVEAAKLEASQDWLGAAMLFADKPDRLIRRSDQVFVAGDRSMFEHYGVSGVPVPLKNDKPQLSKDQSVVALNWALATQESQDPNYFAFREKLQSLKSKAGDDCQTKYSKAMEFLSAVEKRFP